MLQRKGRSSEIRARPKRKECVENEKSEPTFRKELKIQREGEAQRVLEEISHSRSRVDPPAAMKCLLGCNASRNRRAGICQTLKLGSCWIDGT